LIGSAIAVMAWGYFLYQGVIDPLGGINTLWPLFGISNQMLAGIALTLCTVILFKMKRQQYAWVTILPTVWLLACTLTAGLQKVISDNPAIGFASHAWKFGGALSSGKVLAPAKSIPEMQRIIFNDYVDATLAILFVAVVVTVVGYGLISIRKAFANPNVTAIEIGAAAPAVERVHA
jgi:carbon starvation protein CstA